MSRAELRNHAALAVVAASLLSSGVAAGDFEPNHLFLAVHEPGGSIREYDPDGNLVRQIGVGSGMGRVFGLAFGPDGLLYACSQDTDSIFVFDAEDTLVREIKDSTVLEDPNEIAFGPGGNLYVTSRSTHLVAEFTAGGELVRVIGANSGMVAPYGVAVAPDGNLLVSGVVDANPQGRIFEFTRDGSLVRVLGEGLSLGVTSGLAINPSGHLVVASFKTLDAAITGIFELTRDGELVQSIDLPSTQLFRSLTFGPSGNLFAVCNAPATAFEYAADGSEVRTIGFGSTGIAFAPYHFAGELSGKARLLLADDTKVSDDIEIRYAPGSREITVLVTDDPADDDDFASLFGTSLLMCHAFEPFAEQDDESRRVYAVELTSDALMNGVTSMFVTVKGDVDDDTGFFELESIKGRLHRAGPRGVIEANIKAD